MDGVVPDLCDIQNSLVEQLALQVDVGGLGEGVVEFRWQ
jgi:hypothetical protein